MAVAANDVVDAVEPAQRTMEGLLRGFFADLPLMAIAVGVFLVGAVIAVVLAASLSRILRRSKAAPVAADFTVRITRLLLLLTAFLLALAIAGVEVGPALAGLGIAGIAVALALQGILENFIAGTILLIRRPFRVGEQIRTNDFEGTVQGMDLRVMRLMTYAGESVLVPNKDVYTKAITNLTRGGKRRTSVVVGIDYRDDHNLATEVLSGAVRGVEGVLHEPEPEVLMCELADSSVNFEVRYWTLPDIRSVRHTQHRVLSACKSAVEAAGLTIPWPIRTLIVDDTVRVERSDEGGRNRTVGEV